MSVALKLYEQLTEATDDRERFRLIADAIGALEERWPEDIVRTKDLRETELRLQADLQRLQGDLRQTELRLQKEIEQVRGALQKEIEQLRGALQMDIEQVRRETEQVRLEVERVRAEVGAVETRLHQALHRQTVSIIGAVGAVVGLIRLLDYLLA
jgi:DNA repair exonuclease SbcCD ATPase subunit